MVWEPGRAHAARCGAMVPGSPFDPPAPRRVPADHDAPGDGCECGKGAALLDAAGARGLRAVTGEVALWGAVLRHERGWRAASAYPASLVVHAATDDGLCFVFSWLSGQLRTAPADELAALLEEVYGVPVAVDPATGAVDDTHPCPYARTGTPTGRGDLLTVDFDPRAGAAASRTGPAGLRSAPPDGDISDTLDDLEVNIFHTPATTAGAGLGSSRSNISTRAPTANEEILHRTAASDGKASGPDRGEGVLGVVGTPVRDLRHDRSGR